MQIPKGMVVERIRTSGDVAMADRAEAELPEKIDTERDAELLRKFNLDPQQLADGLSSTGSSDRPIDAARCRAVLCAFAISTCRYRASLVGIVSTSDAAPRCGVRRIARMRSNSDALELSRVGPALPQRGGSGCPGWDSVGRGPARTRCWATRHPTPSSGLLGGD